jgi:hypothetical protein
MDYRQAIDLLYHQPLKFGDAEQVAALHFLDKVANARARLTYCRACKGLAVRRGRLCDCIAHEPPDVLRAIGVQGAVKNGLD